MLKGPEHPQRHQQRGDRDVEHQPDDPPRVAVGEPREEVRPGKRSGVGVRDVDLDLRQHDKEHRHRHHPGGIVKNVGKPRQVHTRRLAGLLRRTLLLQHQEGEERAAQHFRHAGQDPAWPGHDDGGPPAPLVGSGLRRQEPQVIDLLADLHDQRAPDRAGGAEHEPVKATVAREVARKAGKRAKGARIADGDGGVGQGEQHEPEPLCPGLQPRDQCDAPQYERNDHDGADDVAPDNGPVQVKPQRQRHDGGLEREKDEGERRVDERGDGRADIAEPGTAGQQIDVHSVAGGVIADGQAREEGHDRDRQDRPERIGEPVVQGHDRADGLERQERHASHGCIGHAPFRPLAKRMWRVAQRVVLKGLVGHPGVVFTPDADDFLVGRSHGQGIAIVGNGRPPAPGGGAQPWFTGGFSHPGEGPPCRYTSIDVCRLCAAANTMHLGIRNAYVN